MRTLHKRSLMPATIGATAIAWIARVLSGRLVADRGDRSDSGDYMRTSLKRTHNAQLCSMPATFKANERCYNRTFGLYGLETLNHRSELKILWDTFRSQNFGFHMIAGSQTIADDHDRRIAGDRRSVFPYDRRRSQNFLRSAIVCDHMETSLVPDCRVL